MAQTKAWLLDLDAEHFSAIGNQHMVEYIASADFEIMPVPLAPDYSPGVMLWRNQIIPVIDLAMVLNPHQRKLDEMSGVMVLTYQEAPGTPLQHGAIVLRGAPQNILVDGGMACPLPESPSTWKKLAVACISSSGKVAPILNVKALFSSSLRKLYKANQQGGPATPAETDTLTQDIEASVDPMFPAAEPWPVDASGSTGDPLAGERPASDTLAESGPGPVSSMPDTQPGAFKIDDDVDADVAGMLAPAVSPESDHEQEDANPSGADPQIPGVLDLLDRAEQAQERIYEQTNLHGPALPDAEELADDTDTDLDETCSDDSHDSTEAQDVSVLNTDMVSDEVASDSMPEESDFSAETHEEEKAVQPDETPMPARPLGGGYRNKYGPGRRTMHGQAARTWPWRSH